MSDAFRSRYPKYAVLAKATSPDWDEQTWQAVQSRIEGDPSARFLTDAEVAILQAVVDRIIPQPDRTAECSVPIVPWIDAKLYYDRRDGYRYEDIPPQREAWRLAIEGIDQSAHVIHGSSFVELDPAHQDNVLRRVERGDPPGEAWSALSPARFFSTILCITVANAYYSHPTAWSEIGYSGPSSPRGHVRIWIGGVDPWEAHERSTRWDTE